MGRSISIYKFDTAKTEKLYTALTSGTVDTPSFSAFLEERNKLYHPEKPLAYDEITGKVKVTPDTILPDELFYIIEWLELSFALPEGTGFDKQQAHAARVLIDHGIDLIYESPTKTIAYGFMFQLGAYRDCFEPFVADGMNDAGMNMEPAYFMGFLEYMRCLLGKIVMENDEHESVHFAAELADLENLRKKYAKDPCFTELLENEFVSLKNAWLEEEADRHQGRSTHLSAEANMYYQAGTLLSECYDMSERVRKQPSHVVIIDSI
jgi:hypothetical protein